VPTPVYAAIRDAAARIPVAVEGSSIAGRLKQHPMLITSDTTLTLERRARVWIVPAFHPQVRFKLLLISAACLMSVGVGGWRPARGEAALTSASGITASAKRSLEWTNHYTSTTAVRYRATVGEGTNQYVIGTDAIVNKQCDGANLRIVVDYIDHLTPAGLIVRRASRREILFTEEGRMAWWSPIDRPLTGSLQLARNPDRVEKMRRVALCDCTTGCFLDGYVDGMSHIVDLIRNVAAPITVRTDTVDGLRCDLVEARTPAEWIRIWVSPSKDSTVVKYVLEQTPAAGLPSRAEFEATQFLTIDDRTLVSAGRSTRSWVDQATHAKWQETVEARRSIVNVHPALNDGDVFTTRDAPNGMRVFLDDLPDVGVDFVWNNGRAVPKVDPALFDELGKSVQRTLSGDQPAPAALAQTGFVEAQNDEAARRMTQLWIVLAGLAAIALLLLAGICLRKRKYRESH
jgi:hypothetical protein